MTLVAVQDRIQPWLVPGDITSDCSALPLTLQFCLLCTHILLFVFLFSVSTTYLLFLEVPRVSDYLGSSQEWVQECCFLLMHFGAGLGPSLCGGVVPVRHPPPTTYLSGA